jgi:hypothetical protein
MGQVSTVLEGASSPFIISSPNEYVNVVSVLGETTTKIDSFKMRAEDGASGYTRSTCRQNLGRRDTRANPGMASRRSSPFRIFPWSTGFTRSDFCWRAVEPHGCSGGGITVVPKSNGQVLRVGPRAARVAMRAHNRKIRFSLWRYLNLLDLHSLETFAEWTGKTAVLVRFCGQVAHATPLLIRDLDVCATVCGIRLHDVQGPNGALVSSHSERPYGHREIVRIWL